MRRSTLSALLGILLVVVASTSVMAARPATSFLARAGVAEQGERLHVMAKVKHPVRGTTYRASAVVHFPSGDLSVELRRAGKSFVAHAKVPVGAEETLGPVGIDVTITYGGAPQLVSTEGTVVPAPDAADDEGDAIDED
jgi:hypothetical protein